jgi:cytochrome c oxidase cbb3-type subunit 1
VRPDYPTPNWLGSVGGVARVFLLVALAAFAMSWYWTVEGKLGLWRSSYLFRFLFVAGVSYLLAALLETAAALPPTSGLVAFTLYEPAVVQLRTHGFLMMALAGAFYFIAPRVAGVQWPSPRVVQVHFWCALSGTVLTLVALMIGGIIQGFGLHNPAKDFLNVMRATVPFLGINTLAMTLLLAGYTTFAISFFRVLAVLCPCGTVWKAFGEARAIAPESRRASA